MAVLAVNASKPVGNGHLHYRPGDFTLETLREEIKKDGTSMFSKLGPDEVDLDNVQGRRVKFHAKLLQPKDLLLGIEEWNFFPEPPFPTYNTWADKYPSWEELRKAAK